MKLLNYNELKTLLLEERDKIPLTVPGAVYEFNLQQPNKHGESMRGGIRIALRCMEKCQPIILDDLRPHGRWIMRGGKRYCSHCGERACVTRDKEDFWYTVGTKFCSECGAIMDKKE